MAPVFVPFDEWIPDEGSGGFGEGWKEALNIYHHGASWRPWKKLKEVGSGTTFGPTTGAYAHVWMSGASSTSYKSDEVTIFAGSKTRIHTVDPGGGTFSDVSRAANYGAANEPAGWRFASVGNDIWATNWLDPMQRRVANAGLFTNGVVSTFTPTPRFIATVREHLLAANLSNAGRFQDEVVWSDADNATNFDPPTGTSTSIAGAKRLVSVPGQITGLVGGQYGLVFKRRAVYLAQYAGPPEIFRFDLLSDTVGCTLPSSIVVAQDGVFFYGGDGFYVIQGQQAPVKISSPALDAYVAQITTSLFPATAVEEDMYMVGVQCINLPFVGWVYRDDIGLAGFNHRWLLYNTASERWSRADCDPMASTVLGLPSNLANNNFPLETIVGFSWSGSASKYAPVGSTSTETLATTMTTKKRALFLAEMPAQAEATVARVAPIFSGVPSSVTVTVSTTRDALSTDAPASEAMTLSNKDSWGNLPFAKTGRFVEVKVQTAAGITPFDDFAGVWVDAGALK